jgi:cytochrome c oxidase subunit III
MSTTTPVDLHSGGGHHHTDDPHHQHHFATMEQQFDTSKIGMWLFLATEVLLFGGLFAGFGLMQARYPQEFIEAHEHLQRPLGALNTVVLLISSFTMVMGVLSAQRGDKKKLVMFLILTILCACVFLGVKYFEYSHKFEEGLLPPRWYVAQPTDTVFDTSGAVCNGKPCISHGYGTFFAFYFMMTGLHGIHILVGIILLAWIAVRANRGEFTKAYYTPVDLVGLYWHLVDLIWIYLFPLFYLIK